MLDLQSRPQLLGIGEQAVNLAQYDALVGVCHVCRNPIARKPKLKQLGLNTFVRNHAAFATDAVQNHATYADYLRALANKKSTNASEDACQRRLKEAKFPVIKQLADFDFSALPTLNQQKVPVSPRRLSAPSRTGDHRQSWLGQDPHRHGTGRRARRQHQRVRFYNTAALVNELLVAQQTHHVERSWPPNAIT